MTCKKRVYTFVNQGAQCVTPVNTCGCSSTNNQDVLAVVPPGGTSGQILVKLSDIDYDYGWADLDAPVTPTPDPDPDPIPEVITPEPVPGQDEYWADMEEFAPYIYTWVAAQTNPDFRQLATYYDGELCRYRLSDHFATTTPYYSYADQMFQEYGIAYVQPNSGAVPTNWSFTEGLVERYIRRGDETAKTLALSLLANTAFAVSDGAYDLTTQEFSREVAYNMRNHIQLPRIPGITLTPTQVSRRDVLLEYALGHLGIWANNTGTYCRPFMVGLTCDALIEYFELVNPDVRILPAIIAVADYIWDACWNDPAQAFLYTDRTGFDPADATPSPDLNMLIAPIFGWLWSQTGNQIWRDKGDMIFLGGRAAGLGSSGSPAVKQYNQQLYWGPLYIYYGELPVEV